MKGKKSVLELLGVRKKAIFLHKETKRVQIPIKSGGSILQFSKPWQKVDYSVFYRIISLKIMIMQHCIDLRGKCLLQIPI